jgi:small subunit ribosomal protein S24e
MSVTSSRLIDVNGYKAEVVLERYNRLIGRREITLQINHMLKPTPSRLQVRLSVAKAYGVDIERVYVRSIRTEYGRGVSRAEVHIYDSVERALAFEPKHIVERNGGVRPQLQ